MNEDIVNEVNNALMVLWKAGRKADSVGKLRMLLKSAEIAILMGFDSETDEQVGSDSAYFIFESDEARFKEEV